MIDMLVEKALEGRKLVIVANKASPIERYRLENHFHFVVVSVQPTTWMLGRQISNNMGRRKGKLFADRVHGQRVS
jgi:hypothetical protein